MLLKIVLLLTLLLLSLAVSSLWGKYRALRESFLLTPDSHRFTDAIPPSLPIPPDYVKTIVLLPVSPLGDTLCLAPFLSHLRQHFNGAKVIVPTSLASNPLWELYRELNLFQTSELSEEIELLIGINRFPNENYTSLFDNLKAELKVFTLWNYSFIPERYTRDAILIPLPIGVTFIKGLSLVARWLTGEEMREVLPEIMLEVLREHLLELKRKYVRSTRYILLHPHASECERSLPLKILDSLLEELSNSLPSEYVVIVVGTSEEREKFPLKAREGVLDLRGKLELVDSLSLGLDAELVIASDSLFRSLAVLLRKRLITWSTTWNLASNFWPSSEVDGVHILIAPPSTRVKSWTSKLLSLLPHYIVGKVSEFRSDRSLQGGDRGEEI